MYCGEYLPAVSQASMYYGEYLPAVSQASMNLTVRQGWGKALSNSLSLKHKHLKFFKHKHYPGIHDLS